ncbi:GerAB/ArcD/ProY family transporter [Alteribacter natronophilus]|uniref:GerAB/ArcD/ProY family transporter n=1 Tax=Alteribacter natronophilus TaxID=2583810 RepID=UPI00110D631D|nr:GerAB/ArcD/ProY family transporter [Alteribacter natronophilus]TMW73905.1 hypothetical protein FGB90_06415 [Alteribacter natronophilus]
MNVKMKISHPQLFFFIVQTQIGVGILSLSFSVHEEAGWDGWMSVFLGGIGIQLIILLLYALSSRYPEHILFHAMELIAGRLTGRLITTAYTIYFITVAILVLVIYKNIILTWLFPATPGWVIQLLLIISAWYLSREKLHIIVRFYVFVSALFLLVVGVLLFALGDLNPLYIFPIGHHGIGPILKGVMAAMQAMLGFSVFMFIFPYIEYKKKRDVLKTATFANLFTTAFYGITVLITMMFFSPPELKLVPQPLLYMLKTFSTPVIDRLDLIFLAMWIVSVTTSLMTYVYLASLSGAHLLKGVKRKKLTLWTSGAIFFIAMGPTNNLTISKFAEGVDYFSIVMVIVIPLLLYLLSLIRGKPSSKGGQQHETTHSS